MTSINSRVPHGLSTPPSPRLHHVAPNGGLLACREGCPYRAAYQCQEADQEHGRQIGLCFLELAWATRLFRKAVQDLGWLPQDGQEELVRAARRWVCAAVYSRRARVWRTRVLAFPDSPERADQLRLAQRYVEAGTSATLKASRSLRELQAFGRRMRAACAPAKAHAAARRILEAANPDHLRPRRLEIPPW